MERHIEVMKDRERLARLRMGVASAAVMNTGMASKRDGTAWMPWDVFPELQPFEEDAEPEEMEANAQAILAMFRGMAAAQRVAEGN